MLQKKPRHLYYALLLIALSIVFSVSKANTLVYQFIADVSTAVENINLAETIVPRAKENNLQDKVQPNQQDEVGLEATPSPMMFATIITNADAYDNCNNDGSTLASYTLCGDFDDRLVTLQGAYTSYEWQQFIPSGGCVFNVDDKCANTNLSCWTTISPSNTFNIDASSINSSIGAGYRVRVNGTGPFYYFNVKKSTITQTFVKRNFICGVPGRIQITNLSSAYEYSIDSGSGFGSWQGPIFDNLMPGTYLVKARLQNTQNTCEYLYDPIEIEQRDIDIDVTFVDAECSGDTGSVSVVVNNVPGPYKYTLLDDNGTPQEFTSFIAADNYVFSAVGFGTYSVSVETQQCKGDLSLGIPPPTQNLDINGNAILIGDGIVALDASTEVNNSFGCSVASVDITVRTSGGTAPYTFIVNGTGPSSSSYSDNTVYTVTSPGSYDLLITDSNGCTITASANVEELTPPDITVSGTDGTCTNGGAKLNFTVVDAKGYNLSYRSTGTDPWVTTPQLPVADGTYNTIEVRYQQGGFSCTMIMPPVTVSSIGSITSAANLSQDYTCANGGGTIDFSTASGGSGSGYEYSLDNVNYQGSTTFTGLASGTYIPYIKDDAGCYQTLTPIVVNEPEEPSAIDFVQDNIDCASGTSSVTINVTSGVAITQYEIVSPISLTQGSNVFNSLTLDTSYQFEITDANGCVYPASFTTGGISTIRARVKSGGDRQVCPAATDGFGAFLVDGFDPLGGYSYSISGTGLSGSTSDFEIPVTNIGAGTYTISVTDNTTNCTSTADLVIVEPSVPLSVTANVTAMSCQNNNVGRVEGVASGGFGSSYKYQLEGPAGFVTQGPRTNRTFGNLTLEGNYTLTVIDSEGCLATDTFTLSAFSTPIISQGATDFCYSAINGASVTVTSVIGSAALATHQYRINGGALQTPGSAGTYTFDDLVPGNHTIEVVDGNNCSDILTVRIPPQVQINLDVAAEIPCGGNGELEIEVDGGNITDLSTTSYTIFLDGSPVSSGALPSNPFSYTVPYAGNGVYTVEVTDSNNCTNTSSPITFNQPTPIEATHREVGPSCSDPNSGFVEVIPTVSSGLPPFEVVFAPVGTLVADPNNPDPTNTYNFSSQTVYSGLSAGSYEYLVKDANGCITAITPVTITDDGTASPSTSITPIDASCSATSTPSGGVTIDNIVGGVSDFTIIIENVLGNQIDIRNNITVGDLPLSIQNSNLVQGNYRVITIDSRGCVDEDLFSIGSNEVVVIPDPTVQATCNAAGFTHCVDIAGGTGPFDIRRVEIPANAWVSLGAVRNYCFPNIQAGESFTVEVFDQGAGCYYTQIIESPESILTLDVDLTSVDGACDPTGQIKYDLEYTVTGAVGSLDIELTNLDTGEVVDTRTTAITTGSFTGYEPGNYGIMVVDTGGCVDGDTTTIFTNSPRVDVISNQNANCNALGQLTVRGSGGAGGPYEYAFVPSGAPVDRDGTLTPGDTSDDFSNISTVALAGSLAPGTNYDIWVRDSRNCEYRTSAAVIQMDPALPAPDITVDNQCDVTTPVGGFTVIVEMPGDIDTPTFTLNGVSQTPVYIPGTPTQATFTVPGIGVYPVNIIDANGCMVDDVAEVYQVLSAFAEFTKVPNCEDPDGIITVTADGGSGDFEYLLTGTDFLGTPVSITQVNVDVFTGLLPGTYEVLITDREVTGGSPPVACTYLVENIISRAPVQPIISDTGESNVSCNGANDGSINAILALDTDADGIQEFNLYVGSLPLSVAATPTDTNSSGSFSGLAPNTYVVEVVTDKGCIDQQEVTFIDPPLFAINATAPPLLCETGANRYSTTTITATVTDLGNGGPYGYKLDPSDSYQTGGTTFDFEIVDTGVQQTFYVYAMDSNGCEFVIPDPIILDPPSDVTAVITRNASMNCEDPENITISVTGSTDFTIRDQGSSIALVPDVVQTSGSSVTFDLPMQAGEYRLLVSDAGGCDYLLEPIFVDAPIVPNVVISEAKPVSCFGADDGELNIELQPYSGIYEYWIYLSNDIGFTNGGDFSGSTPIINGNGIIDMTVSGNPTVITGLPGGNLRVVIKEQGNPKCLATSNVSTIRTPNGPLSLNAIEIGNVSCNNNTGKIEATGLGGWDIVPYEYSLSLETPLGSNNFVEIEAFGVNNEFDNLSSGNYRVAITDMEGCEANFDVLLSPIDPIVAGIREPQGLVCPGGNNAVLEAFDLTTGDILTATAGASGGVLGAGYKYQLIYLGSNDINDELSRSGLQDSPSFSGSTGGFISAGWYAIEVSSSYDCVGITAPYYVDPPPPIQPRLVQVQAPGCGGHGQIRLSVENPELGYVYEYRAYNAAPTDPYVDMVGSFALINVGPGFYQYDIRKKDLLGLNVCNSVRSQGISLVDAEQVELVPNLPDDISCASELDGRIESFAAGGVGNYQYTLYVGDPGNPFSPNASSSIFRPAQDDGTFEGLPEGTDYYIGVTSGLTCGDIKGPMEIIRPAPIEFNAISNPVSCYGLIDGSVTIEVTSGGEGLIQFAISPDFNKFYSDPLNPNAFTFTDLAPGMYEILIQDEKGCNEKSTMTVTEPDELSSTFLTTPETCINASDGSAQLTMTGGTPFVDTLSGVAYYETRIIGPNSVGDEVFVRNDSLFFDNLMGGETYVVFVRDSMGCEANVIVPITIGVDLNAEAIVEYGCEGIFPNSTVSIRMADASLMPRLLFSLDVDDMAIANTDTVFGDLPAGDHTVYIYHENGCATFVDFTVEAYEPLILTAIKTGPNEVTATATGGFGDYEYFFQGDSYGDVNVFLSNQDTNVTVRVIDSMGCEATMSIPFKFTGMLEVPNFFTPNGDNMNDEWSPGNRDFFPNIEVKIYDRYGRVVAILDQVSGWDGNYEGKAVPSGDYWYEVNANDEDKQQFFGHFTLYR